MVKKIVRVWMKLKLSNLRFFLKKKMNKEKNIFVIILKVAKAQHNSKIFDL